MKRHTGKTTKQIINAPINAIYICLNPYHMDYCKKIAFLNNRKDIEFVSCTYFIFEKICGKISFVIIDHAIQIGRDISIKDYQCIKANNHKLEFFLND